MMIQNKQSPNRPSQAPKSGGSMTMAVFAVLGLCVWAGSEARAEAEPVPLAAAEVRALVSGKTLVLDDPDRGLKDYYAEDGRLRYDPAHGYPVEGRWSVRESDGGLCEWSVNPDKVHCGKVGRYGERIVFDWGDGWTIDLPFRLEPGDLTDTSDNPGATFDPSRSLALPADLEIRPPGGDVSSAWGAISGAWYGSWYAARDYAVIIEEIEAESAQVVYAWGPNKFRGGDPGWQRASGRIEAGALVVDLGGWTLTARARDDGLIEFEGENSDWAGRTLAAKWDDVPLAHAGPLEVVAPDPAAPRDRLAFWELQIGEETGDAPLHNDHFMPLGETAAALHRFEGRLTIGESKVLGRPAGSRGGRDHDPFPAFSVEFFTVGDRLVPVERGLIRTAKQTDGRWDIILGPGRLWSEPDDQGWSRASFPFLMTEPLGSRGHNGIATFLFDDSEVSHLRFQVVKETTSFGHLDIWGAAEARYESGEIESRADLEADFRQELAARIPFRRLSELAETQDPELVASFDGGSIRSEISTSALIIDGTVYATPCRTRYGPFPYCREMRHGVASVTKSMVGWLAMLRLAEKFGDSVFDLKVADYVEIPAAHDGWAEVSFAHALGMVSGIGEVEPTRVSHYVETYDRKARAIDRADSLEERLAAVGDIGRYPWTPGEVFRYSSHDPLVLSAAMDALLKSKEGPNANLWDMMNREVFQPLGIVHMPASQTLESDGAPGVPLNAYGLFITLEEVVRITDLIQNGGAHQGVQILHAARLRESLTRGHDLGKPTGWLTNDGAGEVTYLHSLWYEPYRSVAGCEVHVPMMSGAGGTSVLLMPNGMTAVRIAGGPDEDDDSGTWDQVPIRKLADAIRPLCGG